jgi:O-antigen/teichoic acid export membrane protein
MKKLVTSTALVGTSSLFGVLTALLRTKLLAVFVGTAGLGLLAQLGNFLNVMSALASLGIGVGMAKYVAEFSSRDDYQGLSRLRRSGVIPVWVASVVAVLLVSVFSRRIADMLFGRPDLAWAVVVSVLAVPGLVQVSFHLAILQGLKRMGHFAKANAFGAAAGLAVLVPLVYFFKWNGAVFHLVAAGTLSFLIIRVVSKGVLAENFKRAYARFDNKLSRELLKYGTSSLAVGALYWLNLLAIRSVIVHRLGADANGLYQVAVGISLQYLMLILNSVCTYCFPRLSELKESDSVNNELRGALRLTILLVTGCGSIILLSRHWIVPLLFTGEFQEAERLLPVQVVADFLKATAWMLGIWLLPQGRLRVWVSFDVLMNAVLIGSFLFLLGRMAHLQSLALMAAPVAHCIAYLLHCSLNYGYARKSIGFRLGGPLRRLLLTSLALVLVCGALPSSNVLFSLGGLVLVAVWARFSVSSQEARAALDIIRNRLTGRRKEEEQR